MELKLEHLAIAMVNNMLLQYFDDERELLHNDCKIVELREEEMTIANSEYQYDVKFYDVNIIARPLSDLTKEIEVNGEKFVPQDKLPHLDLKWLINSDNLILKTNYEDVLKLLSWHFDIYNLIENGLAIDVNTLSPSPNQQLTK